MQRALFLYGRFSRVDDLSGVDFLLRKEPLRFGAGRSSVSVVHPADVRHGSILIIKGCKMALLPQLKPHTSDALSQRVLSTYQRTPHQGFWGIHSQRYLRGRTLT